MVFWESKEEASGKITSRIKKKGMQKATAVVVKRTLLGHPQKSRVRENGGGVGGQRAWHVYLRLAGCRNVSKTCAVINSTI